MSAVPQAVPGSRPVSISRPGTLSAAIAVAVLTGLAAIANAVIILTGGMDLVKEVGNKIIANELAIPEAEVQSAVDLLGSAVDEVYAEAQSTFQTRAYLILVAGAALVIFGLLMRKAGTLHRVLVTVSATLAIVFGAVIGLDAGTSAMIGLAWAAVLGSVLAIVLTWLPANGRYGKAMR